MFSGCRNTRTSHGVRCLQRQLPQTKSGVAVQRRLPFYEGIAPA
jgi:hypothetical protein